MELRENFLYVFALLNFVMPFIFVWHTELVFIYNGGVFTNGFAVFDGLEIYHVLMYTVFVFNGVASLLIIKNNSK